MIKSKYIIIALLTVAELMMGNLQNLIFEYTFVGDLVAALSGRRNSGDRNGLNPH